MKPPPAQPRRRLGRGTFTAEMAKLTQPVSTILYHSQQTCGEMVDTDHVWMGYAFHVTDPAASPPRSTS